MGAIRQRTPTNIIDTSLHGAFSDFMPTDGKQIVLYGQTGNSLHFLNKFWARSFLQDRFWLKGIAIDPHY
jgi:hypothetical protein